jgi:predicted permease
LLTGLLAGVAPALQGSRPDLTPALKAGEVAGRHQPSRVRSGLLVGQIALTVVLLVGAGLLARSLRNIHRLDPGFDAEHTILATIDLRQAGYHGVEINSLYLRMLERVAALPGVGAVAATAGSPFGWSIGGSVSVPGRDSLPRLSTGSPYYQVVTPGYFVAMGTPVRGRDFTAADRGAPVAIVNETMARLLWPGQPAVGKCIRVGDDKRCDEIIGLVPDARRFGLVEDPSMQFYVPLRGDSNEVFTALVIRALGRPADIVASVRQAMQTAGPGLPFVQVTPLADRVAISIRPWRLGSTMFTTFALLACLLAAVGLYGVLAYTATQRTHEIGVRMAMGASRYAVLRLVMGYGLGIAAVGAAIGALAALASGRVLSSLLYAVSPSDPLVLLGAGTITLLVAVIAGLVPARRATRVDPMVALRYE